MFFRFRYSLLVVLEGCCSCSSCCCGGRRSIACDSNCTILTVAAAQLVCRFGSDARRVPLRDAVLEGADWYVLTAAAAAANMRSNCWICVRKLVLMGCPAGEIDQCALRYVVHVGRLIGASSLGLEGPEDIAAAARIIYPPPHSLVRRGAKTARLPQYLLLQLLLCQWLVVAVTGLTYFAQPYVEDWRQQMLTETRGSISRDHFMNFMSSQVGC